MKLSVALVCPSLALVVQPSSRIGLRPSFSVVPGTDDLLDKVDAARQRCVEQGQCEVDQFLEIKQDLLREMEHFEHQLQVYDDPDMADFDDSKPKDLSGASSETRALRRLVVTPRNSSRFISSQVHQRHEGPPRRHLR